MKSIYCYTIAALLLLAGCSREEEMEMKPELPAPIEEEQNIPEGYFVATFSGFFAGDSRAPVTGTDNRIGNIRYLVYKSTGEFVKERVLLSATDETPNWPFGAVRDTLPKGSYKAVFLGNVEKTLFPYQWNSSTAHQEVLTNYTETYEQARIQLPAAEFSDSTEYYWDHVEFSDALPNPTVLLQRIIGLLNVHRNSIDAQTALDTLVYNIVTQLHFKDLISTTVSGLLGEKVENAIGGILFVTDAVVNEVTATLLTPVIDALYELLLQQLVHQIGTTLAGNEDQEGLLGVLGELLNPWALSDASAAVVYITNFPRAIDFDLNVTDYYTGTRAFRYNFTEDAFFAQKCFHIRGFSGEYRIDSINVYREGLVGGVVVDGILDNELLFGGAFVDIIDSLKNTTGYNYRYKADYSLLDLGLKSYTAQTDGNHDLDLSIRLGDVLNLDDLLGGVPIVSDFIHLLLTPLENISIGLPINLPLLGIDNLTVSGGWSVPHTY